MPGGGLYRRVTYAAAAFGEGPDSIIQKRRTESPRSKPDKGGNNAPDDAVRPEFCDVRAFSVWYWSDEGTFVPETLYLNVKDVGHTSSEPRLVVSLSSFEALSQAYVKIVEKEGLKAAALAEKEDLLSALRVGYYKELMHLRELLEAAREQMALQSKRNLDDAEMQRMRAFEIMVKKTDVHYFNIIDYLEPELKAIMSEGVKSFNRDLMKENFDLRDRLALHEGSEGDANLVERVLTMLLGRGISPAKIVKMVSDMICDGQQSVDFHKELSRLLNLGPRADVDDSPVRVIRSGGKGAGPDKVDRAKDESANGRVGDTRDAGPAVQRQVTPKQAGMSESDQSLKDEIARLKAEIKKLMKQLQDSEQALASAKAQFEKDLQAAIDQCKKEMMAKMKVQQQQPQLSSGGAGGDRSGISASAIGQPGTATAGAAATGGGGAAAAGAQGGAGGAHKDAQAQAALKDAQAALRDTQAALKDAQAALDAARRRQAEADRRIEDLLRQLREAQALIAQLKGGSIGAGAAVDSSSSSASAAGSGDRQCPTCGSGLQCLNPECVEYAGTREEEFNPSKGDDGSSRGIAKQGNPLLMGSARERGEGDEFVATKRKAAMPTGPLSQGPDRSGLDRSGNYSALTGKPMLLVEDELRHERDLRIKYEIKNKELGVEIEEFKHFKKEKDREIAYLKRDLSVTEQKLEALIEEDKSDGVEDVQVFCNWLVKKYGSLDAGFRALDDDSSGGMSLTEFIGGLKQMGWLKIVGKRLYKIFDPRSTGNFTLSQLHDVYDKYVHGKETDDLENDIKETATEDAKEKERIQAMRDLRSRIKALEDDKTGLSEEVVRLQRKLKREDIAQATTSNGADAKALERKVDSIKAGYESLKQERDDVVSKMTAAMWKCRVAHIAQVKLGREAANAKEELKKLQNKFEFFKSSMKRQRQSITGDFSASTPALGATAPTEAMAMTWTPGAGDAQLFRKLSVDELVGEHPPNEGGGAFAPRRSDVQFLANATGGGATLRCPKCQATVDISEDSAPLSPQSPKSMSTMNHSQSPTSMRAILENAVHSSPSPGDAAGGGGVKSEAAPGARATGKRFTFGVSEGSWAAALSAEELVGKMTDEELLFGGGPNSSPDGQRFSLLPGDEVEASMHKGAGSTYRARLNALGGARNRWQALFADACERQKLEKKPEEVPSNIMLTKESVNLIQHARKVSDSLYHNPVPLEFMPQLPSRLPESEAGPESGAGLAGLSISGSNPSGSPIKAVGGGGRVSLSGSSPAGIGGAAKALRSGAKQFDVGSVAKDVRTMGKLAKSAQADRADFAQVHRILERGRQDGPDISHVTSSPAISSFSTVRQGSQQAFGPGMHGKMRQSLGLSKTLSNSGLAPLENHFAQRKARSAQPSPEELAPPLLIVGGSGDGAIGDPLSEGSPAAAAAAAAQPRARTAPSRVLSDTGSFVRETRAVGAALGANGVSPFAEQDAPDMLKTSGSIGTLAKPQGMWMRHTPAQARGRRGTAEAAEDQEEELGSGLPQQPPSRIIPMTKKALRQESVTKQLPRALKRGMDAVLNGCMSMPDLRLALGRHANVARTPLLASDDDKAGAGARTAPLERIAPLTSSKQTGLVKKKSRSPSPDTEGHGDNVEAVPFETPLLYVGKPPPGEMPKRDAYAALQGAGHAVPAGSLRIGLARAAAVFELGSHVQTHCQADEEEEPLSPSTVKDLTSSFTVSSYQ